MDDVPPRPEKLNESAEENAEPAAPVQLALTGGGHTAGGRDPPTTPRSSDAKRPRHSITACAGDVICHLQARAVRLGAQLKPLLETASLGIVLVSENKNDKLAEFSAGSGREFSSSGGQRQQRQLLHEGFIDSLNLAQLNLLQHDLF